jgi:hypothetical protein
MEIRDTLRQVGEKYEPEDSDFRINQATTQEEFDEMEELLKDEETKKLVVGIFRCRYINLRMRTPCTYKC